MRNDEDTEDAPNHKVQSQDIKTRNYALPPVTCYVEPYKVKGGNCWMENNNEEKRE